jgi:hypothetical protein
MAQDNSKRMAVTVEATTVGLIIAYPDGSLVQLTMPRPVDLDEHSSPKAEAMVARLARRLLLVAAEDLA